MAASGDTIEVTLRIFGVLLGSACSARISGSMPTVSAVDGSEAAAGNRPVKLSVPKTEAASQCRWRDDNRVGAADVLQVNHIVAIHRHLPPPPPHAINIKRAKIIINKALKSFCGFISIPPLEQTLMV